MRNLIIVFIVITWLGSGCRDITVGYLLTEGASYNPDTLIIKSENTLDAKGEDYTRVKWEQPWVSTQIEGIEGTSPIIVSIKSITSEQGNADKLWKALSVRGNGIFEVPLHHDVPVGRYVISLNFSNEGYSKDVNDCFTIIVK